MSQPAKKGTQKSAKSTTKKATQKPAKSTTAIGKTFKGLTDGERVAMTERVQELNAAARRRRRGQDRRPAGPIMQVALVGRLE